MAIQKMMEHSSESMRNLEPLSTKEKVFIAIQNSQPISRSELTKNLKIPRTTIYDAIVKLMVDKEVVNFSVNNHKRGRSKVFYRTVQ